MPTAVELAEGLLGAGSSLAGLGLAYDAYSNLGDLGSAAQSGAQTIAERGLEQTAFTPYSVTTSTGSQFNVDPSGNVTTTVGGQEQNIQQAGLGGAYDFMGQAATPNAQTEMDVYNRIRELQRAEEQQAALELENRLFAQGRLGTSSDMYGGATPEQMALAQARANSMNQASLLAMQQARADQMQNAQLANAFLGMGYMPQAQALNAAGFGLSNAQLLNASRQYGAGLFGEAAMGGLEASIAAGLGQATLGGNIGSALLSGSLGTATGENGWLSALFG